MNQISFGVAHNKILELVTSIHFKNECGLKTINRLYIASVGETQNKEPCISLIYAVLPLKDD